MGKKAEKKSKPPKEKPEKQGEQQAASPLREFILKHKLSIVLGVNVFLLISVVVLILKVMDANKKYEGIPRIYEYMSSMNKTLRGRSDAEAITAAVFLVRHYAFIQAEVKQLTEETDGILIKIEDEYWEPFQSSLYRFFSEQRTWPEGKKKCESLKSVLATVHSLQEETYLHRETRERLVGHWIGLYKGLVQPVHWTWLDGKPVLVTYWADGQPDNDGGREYCVEVAYPCARATQCWHDRTCSENRAFICRLYANVKYSKQFVWHPSQIL